MTSSEGSPRVSDAVSILCENVQKQSYLICFSFARMRLFLLPSKSLREFEVTGSLPKCMSMKMYTKILFLLLCFSGKAFGFKPGFEILSSVPQYWKIRLFQLSITNVAYSSFAS